MVNQVSENVLSVLDADDTSEITVSTSESLAQLRLILEGTFGEYRRPMILIILAVTVLITATILSRLIVLRRKDYGRRRALGATRGAIIYLILSQLTQLAVVGVGIGLLASMGIMRASETPMPDGNFLVALSILAIITVEIAGVIPALMAANLPSWQLTVIPSRNSGSHRETAGVACESTSAVVYQATAVATPAREA